MDLVPVLKNLGEAYTIKRTVGFETVNMTVNLQTLSALEEVKVLESCKDLEGSQYLQTLKRNSLAYAIRGINGTDLAEEIIVEGEDRQSRFLFLCKYLDQWPASIRDVLFEVFTDMNVEMEKKVNESAKFTRYAMANPDFQDAKPMFRRVEESEPEDEMEKLKKKVDAEIDTENAKISNAG